MQLKSTGGVYDFLELYKGGPTAGGTIDGIPLANLSYVSAGASAGPLMLRTITNNPMYFLTNNLERMRITSDGMVGIGTTSPGAGLVLAGAGIWKSAIGIENTTTGMEWRLAVNGNTFQISKIPGATFTPFMLYDDGQVEFPNTSGSPRVRILDNGNVGIGTTTPITKLDVVGDVQIPAINDYTYASPKTQYQTVSHAAFVLAATNTSVHAHRAFFTNSPYMIRTQGGTAGATAYFIAPVELPDGATVTNLDVRLYDIDNTYDCKADLVRQPWDSAANDLMASVATTGFPGQVSLSTSTITFPIIDKSTYSYAIVFTTTEANTYLGLYNARITYTVDKAN